MAVRIRLKKLGRRHRPYFRICVMDSRTPRDGKVIEEVGTYDPLVKKTDERCTMRAERIDYWIGVGALPTERVARLIEKYKGKVPEQRQDRPVLRGIPEAKPILATPKSQPAPPEPEGGAPAAEAPAEASAPAEAAPAETPAE